MPDLKVPKLQEQRMRVPPKQGGSSDMVIKNPKRVGAQTNPAASPDDHFSREFSAEKDFGTLYAAKQIKLNTSRYKAAMAFAVQLKKSGGPTGERGPDNHTTSRGGSPRRASNSKFDNVPNASKPNHGSKADGGKGRW